MYLIRTSDVFSITYVIYTFYVNKIIFRELCCFEVFIDFEKTKGEAITILLAEIPNSKYYYC